MSNFRIKLFGLAGVAMAFSGMAYGQAVCTAGAAPAPILIRSEGTTEQLPVTTISCTAPGAATTITVQDFLSLPGTSKVLNTTTGVTEAAITINGVLLANLPGAGTGGGLGTISGNTITWTFQAPAIAFTLSIQNVRVNANGSVATTGAPTPVTEQFFITGPAANITATSLAAVTVAYVENGLATAKNFNNAAAPYTTSGSNNFVTCSSSNLVTGQNFGLATTVLAGENFATAFKTSGVGPIVGEGPELLIPIGTYNTQTTTVSNAPSSATRIQLTFANVPSGATVYVPLTVAATYAGSNGNGTVFTLTASATGAFSAVPATTPSSSNGLQSGAGVAFATPVAAVSVSGGTGTAVYELTTPDQTSIATLAVPVYLYAAANTITASSTALSVTYSFAPTGSTNIPNFTSTGTTTTLTSSVYSLCTTSLLFPFVTNQVGFDTGVSIANTSTDPFGKTGAVPQTGTCTLNFYGNGAPTPSAVTGPSVPTGTNYTFQLSSVAPGFQGYMIAQCNFQYAHAFAFATNGASAGNAGVAFSYLAGVIPNGASTTRTAGAANAGEALAQ